MKLPFWKGHQGPVSDGIHKDNDLLNTRVIDIREPTEVSCPVSHKKLCRFVEMTNRCCISV